MKTTEHTHQVMLINWFRINYPELIIFSVPNGGKRDAVEMKNLKREGLLKGSLDLVILANNGKSIYLEMKQAKGKLSKEQKAFIKRAEKLGHICLVAYSFEEAKEKLQKELL